jgi:hypothetical protein
VLSPLKSLDFVVPDAELAAASSVISAASAITDLPWTLVTCPDTKTCYKSDPDTSWPTPTFHLHIDGHTPPSLYVVCLFLQSETLWFLPPFGVSLANPRANPLPRYLALACDQTALPHYVSGLGTGFFASDQTVVLVPKIHILLESGMRITARDHGKRAGNYAGVIIDYIGLYINARGFLDIDLLPGPFRWLYKTMNDSSKHSPLEWQVKLMRTCGVPVEESDYR